MRTENFLNTLILSLSVSTVLITLLSYLIYKLKQFPKSQDQSVQPRKKEGVFFRRHIPGEVVARENESQKTAVPSKLARFNTMPWYFGILALIIFCSIFFKDIFGTSYSRWVRKKEVSELEALRASGLLKSYDFDPSIKSESPTEAIPETYRSWVDQKIEHLKSWCKFSRWPNR